MGIVGKWEKFKCPFDVIEVVKNIDIISPREVKIKYS